MASDALRCPSNWPGGSGAALIRSGSSTYGGILAADGNQLLGIHANYRSPISQRVVFSSGAMYNLTFYAASDTSGPVSVVAYVGPIAVLTLVSPPTMVMTFYSVSFIADASSQSISFESTCASGGCVAFIDMVMITQGLFLLMVCGDCLIDIVHPIISVIVGAVTTSDPLAVKCTESDIFTYCG